MQTKYFLYTSFVFIVALFLLTGCQKSSQESSANITIIAWISYQGPELTKFQELCEKFTETYEKKTGKKVTISPQQVPFHDLVTAIKMACISRRTPDIARVDVQKMLELAYHKVLVKLDQLPNFDAKTIQEKGEEFMPVPFATNVVKAPNSDGVWEEHLYGLPEQPSCLALFWNRKMFRERASELEKAGLDPKRAPQTWDELVAYGKVLTWVSGKDEYYGFAMDNTLWGTFPFFGCYGAEFVKTDKNGKMTCVLGDTLTSAALQCKVDLYNKHKIEAGAWRSNCVGNSTGFQNEKYAMILMGPWFVQKFRNQGIDFGVALIPGISKSEADRLGIKNPPVSATNVGGNDLVIFESCKYKEIAYDFINFMTNWETQADWCNTLKQIPANRKAGDILLGKQNWGQNKIEVDPIIEVFMEQMKYATLPARLPQYRYIESDVVNPEMEFALKGAKTVQDALKSAAEKINLNVLNSQ